MLNHITIMGRLTRDPEFRRTGSGTPVTSFTLAVDRDFSSNGEKETDFIDCVAWRNTAEFVHNYFNKGRMAVVSGRLQIRTWKDKDGNNRKAAEVVVDNVYFGDSKPDGNNGNSYGSAPAGNQGGFGGGYSAPGGDQYSANGFDMLEGEDGHLPF